MMDAADRGLLETAAQAAGVRYDQAASKPHPKSGALWGLWLLFDGEPPEHARRYWNPLTDDGDAMRLAVKLNLHAARSSSIRVGCWAEKPGDNGSWEGWREVAHCWFGDAPDDVLPPREADQAAATRRAIVLAAAAKPRAA